jgi:DNA-binding transcriptional ArsR family regulator
MLPYRDSLLPDGAIRFQDFGNQARTLGSCRCVYEGRLVHHTCDVRHIPARKMKQLTTTGGPIAFGLNPKLASALTDPLRGQILAELDRRMLSPSQFTREAGEDISRVSRCFRQLERCGYAEVVEERPGSRRGRSIEHVYRRIPNRQSDSWTWPEDPRVERALSSFPAFEPYFARIVEAVEAGTFDQEVDRHLSWDIRALDEIARSRVTERLDRVYAWVSSLEEDASRRRREASREVIPATVGLFALPSPQSPTDVLRRQRGAALTDGYESPFRLPPEIANAMANRWRARILLELLSRPMSPSHFVERIGGDASYVARCFRDLADWGLIELIETRTGGRRRGGVERVYRNARDFHFHLPAWQSMPQFMRVEVSSCIVAGYLDRLDEAIRASSPHGASGDKLVWRPGVFDRAAWREMNAELDRILDWIMQLERESVERVGPDREGLMPTAIGMACFRSSPR